MVGFAAQLVTAAIVSSALSSALGEPPHVELTSVGLRGWLAVSWLVVASTLIGYAVFLWLERTTSPTLANTFFYVAPVVAMGLAWLLLDEWITYGKGVAAAVALVGVALMVTADRPRAN